MPNFLRTAAAVLAGIVVSACAGETPTEDDELVVLTTFTVIADMTQEVAGDRARVESLTRVGAEIHGYEPTPSDLIRALDADLVLDNGLGLEAWFERFVADIDAPRVTLSADVDPLPIRSGVYEGAPNPHAWMSPDNAALYVRAIQAALTDIDPNGAEVYAANADAYIARINEVGDVLIEALATLAPDRRVLVTCEGAFSYLARDGGLDEVYLWPVNADTLATPQSIAEAITTVDERDIPAVFCESTANANVMEGVARESGAVFGGTLYVDSLSAPDGPVPTYLDLLSHNVDVIIAGLAGGTDD